MDSFDAARVLIPRLQKAIAEKVGLPFYFGVPNRDFFCCFNKGAEASFRERVAAKIVEDFNTQAYPLSPNLFEMDQAGNIIEHVTS